MSQRDIEDTLREIYGSEISQGMISRITDKILPQVNEWQNRPLDSIYPVVFFDGIVFNSRKDSKPRISFVLFIRFGTVVNLCRTRTEKRCVPI